MIDIISFSRIGFKYIWLYILEIVLGYIANFTIIISGIWLLDLFSFEPRSYTYATAFLTVFSSTTIPVLIIVTIGERFGKAIKSGKKLVFAFAFLGALSPMVVALFMPPDAKFGHVGGVIVLTYFLSPLCASITYNVSRHLILWKERIKNENIDI